MSKPKKKFKDTQVGQFLLNKIPNVVEAVAGDTLAGNVIQAIIGGSEMTDEDKAIALKKLELERAEIDGVTRRWVADARSGSWLASNVRPLVLVFLTLSYVIGWYLGYPLDSITGLLSIVIGGYFGGNRFSSNNKVNFRIGDRFNTSGTLNYNRLNLPNGTVNAIISGARFAYSFTPRMFLQSLIQYNNVSKIASVNARFGWLQNANTGLFIVFNIIQDNDYMDLLNNQSVTLKYSYQFDVLKK